MPSEAPYGGGDHVRGAAVARTTASGGATARLTRILGKCVSLALFAAMWTVPDAIHQAGYGDKIGSAVHTQTALHALARALAGPGPGRQTALEALARSVDGLAGVLSLKLPIYNGKMTLPSLSFLFFYAAWLEWTAQIVNPRHYLRLHTGALWISPVVGGLFFCPLCFQGFLTFVAYCGLQEYRTILYSQYRRAYNAGRDRDIGVPEWTEALHEWCGVLVAAAGVVSDRNFRLLGAAVGVATCVVVMTHSTLRRAGNVRKVVAFDIMGLLYVALPISLCNMTLAMPHGQGWVLLLISCSWIGDGGAYFIGGRFGRHKCCPSVSPGKSWEGVFAELGWTILTALFIRWLQSSYAIECIDLPMLSKLDCIVMGSVFTVGGVAGDLCESMLKRLTGFKDSGEFFPGHGGILDRFDGMFFSAILLNMCLLLGPMS